MKFLSIFGSRPRQAERAASDMPPEAAIRAAEIFGVPDNQLTPQVRAAFNALVGEIDSLRLDVEQLKLSLAEAEASADHDTLAPVYNRRAFVRETSRVLAMVRRHEVEASMIYFDLNGFKTINDSHGHAAGDAVLRAIAETLLRQTRETDIVGRIGGDEFAVLLTHVSDQAARIKAETLSAALRTERILWDGEPLEVSASTGVAPLTPNDTAERALARADEAMYADKALHRRARA